MTKTIFIPDHLGLKLAAVFEAIDAEAGKEHVTA